jgi:hypothetical protein
MDQPESSNKSADDHPTIWSQQQALELWKYFDGMGATDKNTMVTVESLLLGFLAAIISYVGINLLAFRPGLVTPAAAGVCVALPGLVVPDPINGIIFALLGLVISVVAGYVSLLYGGYSNWNWAKAAAIAADQAKRYAKWNDLLPKHFKIDAQQKTSNFCRWARNFGGPCDATTQLPPIFCVYTWLATLAILFHLIVLIFSASCIWPFWMVLLAIVLALALLVIVLLIRTSKAGRVALNSCPKHQESCCL